MKNLLFLSLLIPCVCFSENVNTEDFTDEQIEAMKNISPEALEEWDKLMIRYDELKEPLNEIIHCDELHHYIFHIGRGKAHLRYAKYALKNNNNDLFQLSSTLLNAAIVLADVHSNEKRSAVIEDELFFRTVFKFKSENPCEICQYEIGAQKILSEFNSEYEHNQSLKHGTAQSATP